jgi:hypothetical protein
MVNKMKVEYNFSPLSKDEQKMYEEIFLEEINYQNWFSIAIIASIREEVIIFTQ